MALLHLPPIPPALEGQEATINRPHPRSKRHWHLRPCGLSWMGIWRRVPKSSSRPQKYRRSRRRCSIHFPLIHQMMIHHCQHQQPLQWHCLLGSSWLCGLVRRSLQSSEGICWPYLGWEGCSQNFFKVPDTLGHRPLRSFQIRRFLLLARKFEGPGLMVNSIFSCVHGAVGVIPSRAREG